MVFEDVRVPRENLLGELNQGVKIFKTMMIPERLMNGTNNTDRIKARVKSGIWKQMLPKPRQLTKRFLNNPVPSMVRTKPTHPLNFRAGGLTSQAQAPPVISSASFFKFSVARQISGLAKIADTTATPSM